MAKRGRKTGLEQRVARARIALLLQAGGVVAGGLGTLAGHPIWLLVLIACVIACWRGYARWKALQVDLDDEKKRAQLRSESRRSLAAALTSEAEHEPVPVAVIGGAGLPFRTGTVWLLASLADGLALVDVEDGGRLVLKHDDLVELEVSGPGTVETNAGMTGGGFGLEGALKGILLAAAVNHLTTSVSTTTHLRLTARSGEVHFVASTVEPKALRMLLSRAFAVVQARVLTRSDQVQESMVLQLATLTNLRETGALSEAEFARAKAGVLERNSPR